jgi:hypothetical protein
MGMAVNTQMHASSDTAMVISSGEWAKSFTSHLRIALRNRFAAAIARCWFW